METKASYIAVGFFTLVVFFAAFGSIYWVGQFGDTAERVPLQVRINGAATGLSNGSVVLFNGIVVGSVVSLSYDPNDPNVALVATEVERGVPLRTDTKANLGSAGVTGASFIQLEGGSMEAPSLFDEAESKGVSAEIEANPSGLSDLIAQATRIAERTEKIVAGLEGVVSENRESLNKTVQNVEVFSQALATNAPGVEKFMASASDMAASIQGLSDKLDGTISAAEKIAQAIDPQKVREVVDNITQFTVTLKQSEDRIANTLKSIDVATLNLTKFSADLQLTLGKVDKVIGAVDADEIRKTVTNIAKTTAKAQELVASIDREELTNIIKSTRTAMEKASKVIEAVKPEQVAKVLENLEGATTDARSLIGEIDPKSVGEMVKAARDAIDRASAVVAAIQPEKISSTVDDLEKTASGARKVVEDVSVISTRLSKRGDDVDKIVTDARELMAKLNNASNRIDGILGNVDSLLGSDDANGVMQEARKTLAAFRTLAKNLDVRVAEVARGINNFTNRGLGGTQQLIRDASRSINRLDRVISNFERNPASLISGGNPGIKEMRGSRVRR